MSVGRDFSVRLNDGITNSMDVSGDSDVVIFAKLNMSAPRHHNR